MGASSTEERGGQIMSDMLTVQQVVAELQVSDETVYRYINSGKLKAVRFGWLWRVPSESLQEFLKAGRNTAKQRKTQVPGK